MGSYPSVTIRYTFPSSQGQAQTIFNNLKTNIGNMRHWDLIHADSDKDAKMPKLLSASFTTPTCGWVDVVDVSVNETDDGIIVEAYSRSTSVCPGPCYSCRCCCICFRCFDDLGQNQQHIIDLINSLHMEGQYQEQLVGTTGNATLKVEETSTLNA
jgi:hypothetical protein